MVACYNYTGTPYVGREVLPEVVYAYGLKEAIEKAYLKKVVLHGYGNTRTDEFVDIAIEAAPGPEVVAGSTRLRAGTATKMVLNMLSTGVMVKLGHVYRNLMVNVQPKNEKLVARAKGIIAEATSANLRDNAANCSGVNDCGPSDAACAGSG